MASPRRFLSGRLVIPKDIGGDHRDLSFRDAPDQHPIEAITGLEENLAAIPEPVRRITNTELEEILV